MAVTTSSDDQRASLEQLAGLGAMLCACAIWGLGPVWIKVLLAYLDPIPIVVSRLVLGSLALLPALLWFDWPQLAGVLRRRATWVGGVFMAVSMACYAGAVLFISPAEVNLLFQINVLVAALLGKWQFAEPVPRRRWGAMVAVLCGVALVISGGQPQATTDAGFTAHLLGCGLGLLAGVSVSLVQACIRKTASAGIGLAALLPMHVVAALLLATTVGFRYTWRAAPDARFLAFVLALGLLASGAASYLVNFALPRISLAQAGITGTMQPVVTLLLVTLAGERFSARGIAGAVLVIGGVLYSALLEREVRRAVEEEPALAAPGCACNRVVGLDEKGGLGFPRVEHRRKVP